ncbi:MAG: T9SS type A sorting domain-containing protein, partial [Bacteroidia bacterium]
TIKDQSKIWYPNPVKDLSDLFCNNCDESDDVLLINSVGKMIFNGKVNKINNNTTLLGEGIYWIITTDSQTGSVQRQVIEIIN